MNVPGKQGTREPSENPLPGDRMLKSLPETMFWEVVSVSPIPMREIALRAASVLVDSPLERSQLRELGPVGRGRVVDHPVWPGIHRAVAARNRRAPRSWRGGVSPTVGSQSGGPERRLIHRRAEPSPGTRTSAAFTTLLAWRPSSTRVWKSPSRVRGCPRSRITLAQWTPSGFLPDG